MPRSLTMSLAIGLLICAGSVGVAPGQQTGPLTPPALVPAFPAITGRVSAEQLYDALRASDPRVKWRKSEDELLSTYTLHLRVGDELRPVVVNYNLDKQAILMVIPLTMPFTPQTYPISAEMDERIKVLNRQIAPCEFFKMPTGLEPDSQELVTGTVLQGPITLQAFEARLKLLMESVATTKPVWSIFPQK
jgi:hypothetical protein